VKVVTENSFVHFNMEKIFFFFTLQGDSLG